MSRCPLEYLRHILDEISYIQGIVCDITQEDFLADETLKRAFVRSIEIIGEAAKKIPTVATSIEYPQLMAKACRATWLASS